MIDVDNVIGMINSGVFIGQVSIGISRFRVRNFMVKCVIGDILIMIGDVVVILVLFYCLVGVEFVSVMLL